MQVCLVFLVSVLRKLALTLDVYVCVIVSLRTIPDSESQFYDTLSKKQV